jgi:2-polyprenyl-3-methyl-5-hydroxy-6-metoxy-1,4-benzoquinol methylase
MNAEFLENIECKVCGNRDKNDFKVRFRKKELNIVQCDHCGFVFLPPYYRKQMDYKDYKDESVLKAVIEGNNWLKIQRHLLRFRTLKKYQPDGKLFDLGVGWGHFLYTGRMLGYEVEGIELSRMPYKYAKEHLNLPVELVDFFDYTVKENEYDLITMWDVLEHIDQCDAAIDKCAAMLKPGGYLALQVPQIDSYIARRQKEKWQAMSPDHVNYFSRTTITRLLEAHGLQRVRIKSSIEVKHFLMYTIYNRRRRKKQETGTKISPSERQEFYNRSVDKPKWMLRIMVLLHNILYQTLSFLRIGDEMIVIARKPLSK